MTTTKPKKRWTEEAQIIAAIDRCKRLAVTRNREADYLDAQADALIKMPDFTESAKLKRLEAKKKRGRAVIAQQNASRLGDKLSEFRTAIMLPVTQDTSIQR